MPRWTGWPPCWPTRTRIVGEPLRGLGVSPGVGTGPAYRLPDPPGLPPPRPVVDPDAERDRAYAALDAVGRELTARAGAAAEPAGADILRAHAAVAGDRTLRDGVAAAIRAGHEAPHAVAAVLAGHRSALLAAGGRPAARAADLDDLRNRVVAHCLGRPMPAVPEPGHPYVLTATDLAPADAALLDPRRVRAVVTAAGGATGHTAILARAKGLPAVAACPAVLDLPDGTTVTVDGTTGHVTTDAGTLAPAPTRPAPTRPAPTRPAPARPAPTRPAPARPVPAPDGGAGRTADGHPVALLANIGGADDLTGVAAEGVGLFRTELLFAHHIDPPSTAEQVAAYRAVFDAMPERPVVVRTLDAGSDKPLPFLAGDREPNPALGIRGVRTARRRPEVLRAQIAALAAAARRSRARVAVMAPMIATVAEAAGFAALCREAGLPSAGAMIEVPAAALRAAGILRVVDFLSVGTNDLSQYAFAADRRSGDLADLLDPWQPALLALIASCAAAGTAAGRPVGVCGEAAADPRYAVVLAGLGVTSLSMTPAAIPAVRAELALRTLDECRAAARGALAADDPESARAAARVTP
jgi:phosphotransferase system enzyme I (PtsI)